MAKRGLPAGFELQGAEGLERALGALPGKLNTAVKGAMVSTGERMAEEVRRAVPVDTGALQRTVELNETLDGVEVSVGEGLSYSFRALADLRATATRAMMMLQDDLSDTCGTPPWWTSTRAFPERRSTERGSRSSGSAAPLRPR